MKAYFPAHGSKSSSSGIQAAFYMCVSFSHVPLLSGPPTPRGLSQKPWEAPEGSSCALLLKQELQLLTGMGER